MSADDYASFWLELDGGAAVSGVLSAVSRPRTPGWAMSAHGSDGSLALEANGTLWGRRHGEAGFVELTPNVTPPDVKALGMPDTPWSLAFVLYAKEIAEALRSGRTEVTDAATFEDGLRSQEVLDALRESATREAWVECAPGRVMAPSR